MRMFVVPDANVLYGDPFLDRSRFALIRREAARGRFRLAVPEVVVREAINLYDERLRESMSKARKAVSDLRDLQVPLEAVEVDVDGLIAEYSRTLRARLSEDGCEILDLPDVPHDTLVNRAVAKRRPFQGHDS